MGTGRERGREGAGILIFHLYFNYIRRYLNKTSFTILILCKVNCCTIRIRGTVHTFLLYKRKLLIDRSTKATNLFTTLIKISGVKWHWWYFHVKLFFANLYFDGARKTFQPIFLFNIPHGNCFLCGGTKNTTGQLTYLFTFVVEQQIPSTWWRTLGKLKRGREKKKIRTGNTIKTITTNQVSPSQSKSNLSTPPVTVPSLFTFSRQRQPNTFFGH